VRRLELNLVKKSAGPHKQLLKNDAGDTCLTINRRLLPKVGQPMRRWLLWEAMPGANQPSSIPAPDHKQDIYLGHYGHYALYVDGSQADRFSEFVIFITAAAASVPNPASNGSATGKGPQKAQPGVLLTNGSGG
jgi:hypothetical protein